MSAPAPADPRAAQRQSLPPELAQAAALPDVLLGYQKRLLTTVADNALTVCEKSRRIGATWGVAALAVLYAAAARGEGGMDALYIGFNLDMAREFIDVCAMWARAFAGAVAEVEDAIFEETDPNGEKTAIKAFRISFASGFEIMALTSKPRSLRGRQGFVIFDEAAFHDQLDEMLKAAMALLMWGGKVLVISTHDGIENAFSELIGDIRSGKRAGEVIRITFDDAVADGLYERVALVRGLDPGPEAKAKWIADTFAFYGEDADEELRVIPKAGSGVYLTSAAIEACMVDEGCVARIACPEGFELRPLAERRVWMADALRAPLEHLAALRRDRPASIGQDFARSVDLSVIAVGQEDDQLRAETPLIVELKNCPIAQQAQVLRAIRRRLPVFGGAKMDATGNGLGLSEQMQEEWGHDLVEAVKISTSWNLEAYPRLKRAIEDRTLLLPRDRLIRDDLRALRLVNGVPSIPAKRDKGRHGDAAVALAMLLAALRSDYQPYDYQPVRPEAPRQPGEMALSVEEFEDDRDFALTGGWGLREGAW